MLVATAIAFLMAVTIPDAFGDAGGWFAATYIAVRVVGLGLYGRVAWEDVAKRTAVRRFAVLSLGGLAAVAAGGVVGGDARAWWWAAAVVLDVAAAVGAGTAEGWDIRPEHFGERHGLFVIIALGESLIVAASGLTGAERTAQTVAVAILAVATTGGLWWSYFVGAKPALDHALPQRSGADRSTLARDVYSIWHFPRLRGRAAGGGHRGGGNSSARSAAGGRQLAGRGRSPVRGQCCRRTAPERLLAVGQTVGDPRCHRRRRLGHARRGSHLSLLVVALGLLLLAAVERPRRKLAVDWLSVFRWHLPARITQESVQEGYSLIHLSRLVGLCVPYIVARSLPRMPIPRTRVNRGKGPARSRMTT